MAPTLAPPVAQTSDRLGAPGRRAGQIVSGPSVAAVVGVLLLLAPYTLYFWMAPRGVLAVLLGFLPGLLGTAALLRAGFSRDALYLRAGRLSWRGGLVLLGVFPLLGVILASGTWQGWDAGFAVESTLSGLSQELYFRASLLPALLWLAGGRLALALPVHALLDVLWHGRMFTQMPPVAWPVVFLVLFVAKLGWGYAAHHDRTLVWVIAQHSLFLVAMSLFTWG